jgi:hypothetical protein
MGGSGGGGSSGKTDYPDYMKDWHSMALDDTGTDTLSTSITEVMDTAIGSSPFATATAYDPDVPIAAWEAAISGFNTILAGIDEGTDVMALYTAAVTAMQNNLDADVDSFSSQLNDNLTSVVLPRFEGGMRNINAVQSSAFIIGRGIIEAFNARDVAKYSGDLRIKAAVSITQNMVQLMTNKYAWEESYTRMVVESNRIKIVAKGEENRENVEYDKADAEWDLSIFKYGGNLLASISGSAVAQGVEGPSIAKQALGGAMAGAAAGAVVGGGPVGALIGGGLGAALAFL